MKNIVIVLLLIISSVFITRQLYPTPEEGMSVISTDELELLQDKELQLENLNQTLRNFSVNEIEKYLNEDDQDVITSDELASKIFLLLLTQLPLNLNPKVKDWIKQDRGERKLRLSKTIQKNTVIANDTVKASVQVDSDKDRESQSDKFLEKNELLDERISSNKSYVSKIGNKFKSLGYLKFSLDKYLPRDISKDLWSKKAYKGKENKVSLAHVIYYLDSYHGEFFHKNLDRVKVKYRLETTKSSHNRNVSVHLQIKNYSKENTFLYIDEKLTVTHPVSHNNSGDGICRGLILTNKKFKIYLTQLPGSNAILGRVFQKFSRKEKLITKQAGAFLLSKNKESYPPKIFSRVQGNF
jgi:hypothetical protein